MTTTETTVTFLKNTNQALGIGRFSVDFMSGAIGEPVSYTHLRAHET